MNKTIIAMGDGGVNPKNPVVDLYILAQSNKKNPKICFLPTASGDNIGYAKYFVDIFENYPCEPSFLTLFNPHTADIEDYILSQDIIYVGGGHTKSMLGVWKEWGVDNILKKAYDAGVVLSGGSAGSVCWFDQCITDSFPGSLSVMNCLGLLEYSNCPHYRSDERREAYLYYLSEGAIKNGYAADDLAALHFVDGKLFRSVSSSQHSFTYEVGIDGDKFIHNKLETIFLNERNNREKLIFKTLTFSEIFPQT